jgi:DNA-binding helix-hairpin-helix protein with protein kinase domain
MSRYECRIAEQLGEGGEGRVYRVAVEGLRDHYALKWYHPEVASPERRTALAMLVDVGPPDHRFLWPIDLAEVPGSRQFGYLMALREPRFRDVTDHLYRRVTPTFRALTTASLGLAEGFLRLHAKGLCYRDISFGNVSLDPATGDVLICDNDNVGIDGGTTSILGTPYFVAPEVLRREAVPSTRTDRFSLAVLLFYMLMLDHPLLGSREVAVDCLDGVQLVRLLGWEPVFIFDPDDDSNRPLPGHQDNALLLWPVFPRHVRDLFTRAFTEGLREPVQGRVTETEWRAALSRLRDAIFTCGRCGQEAFFDGQPRQACPNPACGATVTAPPRLEVDGRVVVLADGAVLYPHHLLRRRYDFGRPLARVSAHPEYAVSGLTNLSDRPWRATTADGRSVTVGPDRTLRIVDGTRVDFGAVTGEIVEAV